MPESRAPTIMVQGTGSGVGKSFLTAALARIYARRGLRVLPFKAQNMSNNAAVTADGGEIGRAQALQARAAGVEPDVRMNPVLLKPLADTRSDVVVLGRSDPGISSISRRHRRKRLWPVVARALDQLRAEADLVIIEGAGSPAETNLRAGDLVNMAVARHARAPVLLVADIDRGGAFAALYGTWALLCPADRATLRGFVLNRFRGDASLLAPAPDELEGRTGVPTFGVVPFVPHGLPEEDAASWRAVGTGSTIVAAVRLPHVANLDDLDPLAAEPELCVRWVDHPDALRDAAAIVIPGTRNTVADLRWLLETGLGAAIRVRHEARVPVVGLCGGYQMLGGWVEDASGVDGGGRVQGLGLLEIETEMTSVKTVRRTSAEVHDDGGPFTALDGACLAGYEIHHGRTSVRGDARPWLYAGADPIGAYAGTAWGAYLHGLFHNDVLRMEFLTSLGARSDGQAFEAHLDREIDRVADVVEGSLDMAAMDAIIGTGLS